MSQYKKNSLAVALVGALVFSIAALQGCSDDEQSTPATGGSGGSHAGAGGRSTTAGTAGKPVSEGGAAGQEVSEAGAGGETSVGGEGGEGGAGPAPCSSGLSFDNSTLTAITDNGGVLPPLP